MQKTEQAQAKGTTSACAENTLLLMQLDLRDGNYLRVRGEYPVSSGPCPWMIGTTSACAENTYLLRRCGGHVRNYLRVRGEYPHRKNVRVG